MAKFDLSFLNINTEEDDPNMKLWKRAGSIGDLLDEDDDFPSNSGALSPRVQLAVKRSSERNANSPKRSPQRASRQLRPQVLKSARNSLKNLFSDAGATASPRSQQRRMNESISSPVSPLHRSTSDHFKAKGFSALDDKVPSSPVIPTGKGPSRDFIVTPVPKDAGIVKCTLIRTSKQKEVQLYFQYAGSRKGPFIMSAYKRRGLGPASFTISSKPVEFHKDTRAHLAVVKANLMKEKYDVYEAPKPGMPKFQMGSCFYEVNEDSPRKTTLLLPEIKNGKPGRWHVKSKKHTMFEQYVKNRTMDMAVYTNVFPHYDPKLDRYVLDLSRRATKPSVKNTVVNGHRSNSRVWLFGKTGPNTFNLDFAYPFTPLQAFAFAIATLHSKS